MRVITLSGGKFQSACQRLQSLVCTNYKPDLVIGVLTGGGYVARQMREGCAVLEQALYTEVKVQRSSTKKKESKLIRFFLQHSPRFILNMMRIVESTYLEHRRFKYKQVTPTITFNAESDKLLKEGNKKVLIIDDAIDTGVTLYFIKKHIGSNYEDIEVKTAVITVTMSHPMEDADFFLYHNRTLVRFPWSKDMKK